MRAILTILLLFLSSLGFSQSQAMVWYFGNEAGIDFNSGKPVSLDNSSMVAKAGCAAISDRNGNLQFYTNGMQVWNRMGNIMENGDSIYGSQYLNQNSIIVPKPYSDSIYYLFTINNRDTIARFTYSMVDMSADAGQGTITSINDTLYRNVVEKIAAVQHCNRYNYWIVVHDFDLNYYAYLLTQDSIVKQVISSGRKKVKADIGYLKISPAGDKLVMPLNNGDVLAEVCDFDNKTGIVSNPYFLHRKNPDTYCFGFEFSPDGNRLYMTTGGKSFKLWQFNLRFPEQIDNSAVEIASGNNFAMQLAPDNKIYVARENSSFLNIINNPNEPGEACGYVQKGLKLNHGYCHKGLPNFVQSWFYKPSFDADGFCFGDTSILTFHHNQNIDSTVWSFSPGEGTPFIHGKNFEVNRLFGDTAVYTVWLSAYHCGLSDTTIKKIKINSYPQPMLPEDTLICYQCLLTLDPGVADSYLWDSNSNTRYLEVTMPGIYRVQMSNESCVSYDSVLVYLKEPTVLLPNAFTPNNDGLNDEFTAVVSDDLANFKMWIYNRQGRMLFFTENMSTGWDGSYQGAMCPPSTYAWKISYEVYSKNGKLSQITKKGFVTLVR